jgi:hypothetical protein
MKTFLPISNPGEKSTIATAMLATVFLCVVVSSYFPTINSGNQYDDSYVTYRYAANLATGKGLTFNSYERINSSSSLLYTLTLAGFYKAGLHDLERVAMGIGIASVLCVIFFSVRLAHRFSQNTWLIVIFLLPLCVSGSLSAWAISGMDTVFYMALVILFCYAYAADKLSYSLLIMALCLVARPEAIILLVATVIAEIASPNSGHKYDRLAKFILVGGVTFGAWIVWNRLYYGTALPNPILIKRIGLYYSPPLSKAIRDLTRFLTRNFAAISIPGLLFSGLVVVESFAGRLFKRNIIPQLPLHNTHILLSSFAIGSVISFAFGPYSDFNRYVVHLLPVLAVLSTYCLELLVRQFPPMVLSASKPALFFVGAIFLFIGWGQAIRELRGLSSFFEARVAHAGARKKLGEYIEQNIPGNQVIMSSDIGALAYAAIDHDFIDVFGLTSKETVAAVQQDKWQDFIQDLKVKRPLWVADTGLPTGQIQSFEILAFPHKYFRGVNQYPEPYVDMYSPRNQTVLEIPVADGFVFRLVRIDPAVYEQP